MKRITSLILASLLIFTLMTPAKAFAATGNITAQGQPAAPITFEEAVQQAFALYVNSGLDQNAAMIRVQAILPQLMAAPSAFVQIVQADLAARPQNIIGPSLAEAQAAQIAQAQAMQEAAALQAQQAAAIQAQQAAAEAQQQAMLQAQMEAQAEILRQQQEAIQQQALVEAQLAAQQLQAALDVPQADLILQGQEEQILGLVLQQLDILFYALQQAVEY